jgi:hypothetical protein
VAVWQASTKGGEEVNNIYYASLHLLNWDYLFELSKYFSTIA